MRCAAIGARTIEVLGAPVNGLHKDKMGEFRMISATEVRTANRSRCMHGPRTPIDEPR